MLSGRRLGCSQRNKCPRGLTKPLPRAISIFWILPALFGTSARATDLKPETVAAFNRYVAATEAGMNSDAGADQFLIVDRLPDRDRKSAYDQLQSGQAYVEELHTQEDGRPIPVPYGLIHHWAGVIFIPKGTLPDANAVLQNYDEQARIYKPDVRRAKVLEQHGDESKIFEQFYSKSIITVVLNAYFHVVVTPMGSTRLQSVSRSTRIAEVENADGPDERERTDGKDHGYMWRLNSYWRIEEKDGGVYVQIESISLSRTVPVFFAWLINPLTKSIPRDLLLRLLTNTQQAVLASRAESKRENLRQ
jgi:hypothetical protein